MATSKYAAELIATAQALTAPGKGLLAADESTGTIGKRFSAISLENNEDNRRAYRELLFTTPDDITQYISGVILYEETLFQKASDGTPFVEILKKRNMIPGIKVDAGTVTLLGTDGETATQGLDKLGERCAKYYAAGARFAKWRAVLKISDVAPTDMAILENAHGLARYAQICQEFGLVPIVEPEVLMDGTHTIEQAAAATQKVQAAVVKALHDFGILFEGMLLKPNMVMKGMENTTQKTTPEDVARYTVSVLARTLPAAVPGVMFLSGGQSEEDATLNLNAINRYAGHKKPWALTFSYGRALQQATIKTWAGKVENVAAAQKVFFQRAQANGLAAMGKYEGGAASALASESLYQKGYTY
eukprot:TRINITY_DN915_c0_g1_i2.p1 TRINITY_DN915_c0_g1~~TRINITY_DN915_c0_g1_i2.p1  ORF type:complete len:383 (+),score=256.86 TRINITY_DN915_c0_g1_i2:72-1151(+)